MSRIGIGSRRWAARALAAVAAWASIGPALGGEGVEFNRDIRPILRETCFQCHGPDSAARKANLRLDKREAAIEAGAIEPGDVAASELIARILSDDPEEVMPPPDSHKVLDAKQKDLFRRWVASGAEYQPHWAFLPPAKVEPPATKLEGWARNPIDRFVLAKMEERGFKPSPEADRRTLARRLSLDLVGLPPAANEVEAFVADSSPEAYDRYVDKLLALPAWGEHRGRYWLDVARYADTHGIHFDNYREMWSYRDWVLNALNSNMPFDQFTIEQVAGDLLPNRTLDQQVASGFNRCNITTNEGGAINEEYLVLYARDRTETASQVFLGLTTGCAVCHDHKFDPISQKEFYELSAFFNNSTQAAMDGNIQDTPPIVFVPARDDRARWQSLVADLVGARKAEGDRREVVQPEFMKWIGSSTPQSLAAQVPAADLKLKVRGEERDAPPRSVAGTLELADLGDFEKDQSFSYGAWVKPGKDGLGGALLARMDEADAHRGWDLWLEGGKPAVHIIHDWPADALKVVADMPLKAGVWSHVLVTYDGSSRAGGIRIYVDGAARPLRVDADTLKGSIRTKVPFKLGQRNNTARIDDATVNDLRVYARALAPAEVQQVVGLTQAAYLASKPADKRTPAELEAAFRYYLSSKDPESQALKGKVAALEAEQATLKGRGTVAHVMNERSEPASAYILSRGDYDKRKEQVLANTPAVLPPMASDLPRNRLGLAQWLVRPENPLMARVTVNRFWQEIFGTGLVRTAGDFGLSGETPTHPELLDYLAVDFRDHNWDVKRFYKLLVTSAAYRQSAASNPEQIEKDPSNRYLARGSRYRMDAEMIRDYALAASGLLVDRVGGPSVRPYQPDGVWEAVAMPGSNTRDYKRDSSENLYRRSMYTLWKRAAPPASMDLLNAPAREVCVVKRERTNTPLQALVTLNDDQFVEAARHLAQLTLRQGGATDEARVDFAARRLLARPLREAEAKVVLGSLADLVDYYRGHPDDASKLLAVGESKADGALDPAVLAAWSMLANELLNLDEVLNK